jgi:hypothetical protein
MGQKISGFFSVKGSKKMEMVYCDFYPNQNGTMTHSNAIAIAGYTLMRLNGQANKNGSDMPTSNRRPSISTSSGMTHFPKLKLQFRLIFRG